MSAVGLTKAMRAALESIAECEFFPSDVSTRVFNEVQRLEFVESNEPCVYTLTPRGHAALAAPRMTQAELDLMERIEVSAYAALELGYSALHCKGWVSEGALTPSGLKALNDVRAAMGSELYKDNMP